MAKKLKVLHVASWFPSEVHRSLGNFVARHVEAVAKVCDAEVWAPIPVKGTASAVAKMRAADGMESMSNDEGSRTIRRLYHEATRPQLVGVARAMASQAGNMDWKPDVVHLHVAYPAGPAAVAWAKKWGVPVVLTEHWTAYHDFKSLPWWRRRVVRDVIRQADVLCPVSEDLGSAMAEAIPNGKAAVHVVPNVVDTALFKVAEPEMLSGVPVGATRRKMDRDGLNRILHVSSMNDDQKNVTGLLDALEGMMRNQDSLRATFVGGEAADLDVYKAKVDAMGLSDRIAFTGPLSTTDVVRQMQSHDVLVLNSRRENFPCVIPEVWACGLPVMSTDVGGIREHLPKGLSGRGFLLDAEASSEAWHAAFQAMNEAKWDAQTIRSYATKHFSMDAVADAYLEAYHKALERGNG
ncbi:MAG: glycosyltransferase [Flavobacteriales bacterium]